MNTRKDALVVGAISVASFALGGGTAYIYTKRKYEAILEQELIDFKQEYSVRMAATVEARANEEAKNIAEVIIARESYSAPSVDTENGESVTADDIKTAIESNVFADNANFIPEWDQEAEEDSRRNGVPFIISKAEYYEGELGFTQMHLSYYEDDDVLTDDEDTPVPDIDGIAGQDNLQKFGYGSGDPRVLYIRNEAQQVDFEVTLEKRSYSSAMGYIQHDDSPGIRRFRMDRD